MNRPYSMRAARVITSEPSFTPHTSQWQAERARGVILPAPVPARLSWWHNPVAEALGASLLVVIAIVAGLVS